MISLKSKDKGFTIVELLIVIVVIGILAALVITTFAGIQRRARDTERTTDVKAIHGHLEAYYAQNGGYVSLADMQNSATATGLMPGLDEDSLTAPNQAGNNIVGGGGDTDTYEYVPAPVGCATDACTGYTLTANLEDGNVYSKDSLN